MKSVTIYTTSTCHFCHGAKDFLKEQGVSFTEKDVTTDPSARQEMIEKTGQMGVPVIDVDGKIIVGFNEPALRQELELQA